MRFLLGLLWVASLPLAGCASSSAFALDRAVMAYDRTVAELIEKQLLLNIARARHSDPLHFTAVSSIAATFNFTVSAGVGPVLTGDVGTLPMPTLGASASENPTVTISPMQGDEFTQRLLTPFAEQKLTMLLRQGYDVDALLRLIGADLFERHSGRSSIASNDPTDPEGYKRYRQVMTHLSALQDMNALWVEPLVFRLEGKPTIGRVIVSNYDPSDLPEVERIALHQEAELSPDNEVLIDVRADHPGGELMPLHAHLRLRSFLAALTFVGRSMNEAPEHDVDPDPRTPPVRDNPRMTLGVTELARHPGRDILYVEHRHRFYALQSDQGYPWNKKAFGLLYQLFQMTVVPAPERAPLITIGK